MATATVTAITPKKYAPRSAELYNMAIITFAAALAAGYHSDSDRKRVPGLAQACAQRLDLTDTTESCKAVALQLSSQYLAQNAAPHLQDIYGAIDRALALAPSVIDLFYFDPADLAAAVADGQPPTVKEPPQS